MTSYVYTLPDIVDPNCDPTSIQAVKDSNGVFLPFISINNGGTAASYMLTINPTLIT